MLTAVPAHVSFVGNNVNTAAFGSEAVSINSSYQEAVSAYVRRAHIESQAERFGRLATNWRLETAPLSSVTAITLNPNYQRIIGMGPDAIPFIIDDLKRVPGHWFPALQALTEGVDPIEPEHYGDVRAMSDAWITWATENGYAA